MVVFLILCTFFFLIKKCYEIPFFNIALIIADFTAKISSQTKNPKAKGAEISQKGAKLPTFTTPSYAIFIVGLLLFTKLFALFIFRKRQP